MKKLLKIGFILSSWIELILIIPILVVDFTIPVLFESPDFFNNKIVLLSIGLLFLYPFLTSWSVLHAKLARKEDKLWWAAYFYFLPLLDLGISFLLYFKFYQIEMDKVLTLVRNLF